MSDRDLNATAPVLSVVIVTWNCRDLVLRCLGMLAGSKLPGTCEIIVVDNASADGTADTIAARFPHVLLVRNARNSGFAGGTNLGISVATAPVILLLNPDAFPATPHTFAALLAILGRNPQHAAVGCRLVFPDGNHQVGDAGFRPSLRHVAAWAFGLIRIRGIHGLFLSGPGARGADLIDVDWICAASLMVRASAIRDVGSLNETFFMYAEDVEWGCRMREHGWSVGYVPGERVVHLQGGTQSQEPLTAPVGWIDSLGRLYLHQQGASQWWLFCLLLWTGFGLRTVVYGMRPSSRGKARTMLAFARHASRLRRSGLPPDIVPREA
jgi:N-acetylglucosaminyl-diphospho-decaprenol L-rhamnosyltransferase